MNIMIVTNINVHINTIEKFIKKEKFLFVYMY